MYIYIWFFLGFFYFHTFEQQFIKLNEALRNHTSTTQTMERFKL